MLKAGFRNLLPTGSKLRDKKYRDQLSIFLVCLLIASFVWLVIKLSKEYTITILWPVEYANVPRGQVLALKGDSTLRFQVRAKGVDLLPSFLSGPSKKVTVDLSGLRYLKSHGRLRNAYLVAVDLKLSLAGQLGLNEALINIEPDTIFFQLAPLHSKKVPVRVELDYQTQPSFGLYGSVVISPDTIRVDGPAAYVDTLRFVKLKKVVAGTLSQSYTTHTSIASRYKAMPLTFSHQKAEVTIPVEKFTEATVVVPIATNDSCRIRFYPEKVNVLCQVAMRDYKRLDASLFNLEVDCKEALNSTSQTLTPTLKTAPPFVKVLRTTPPQVEFIILK